MSKLAIEGGAPIRASRLPYGRQWITQDDVDAVVATLRSDWLTTGPKVAEFEMALKQVPACEYNPFEAVKTNIFWAENVIDAALASGVRQVIALSMDKAAAPTNVYGATKLASDKLFVAADNHKGNRDVSFSIVRYGNVMGIGGLRHLIAKELHV